MSRFNRLLKNHLCLGCGLCESIGRDAGYKISLRDNGFYEVEPPAEAYRSVVLESRMAQCCPSISIKGVDTAKVWGNNVMVSNAWSTDEAIRHSASSGGFTTGACIYMLESGMVDGILHVGVKDGDNIHNVLKVSRTPEEVKNNCSSRYAPALMFDRLKQILDSSAATYALVGKSCDILCINNFENAYPQYRGRIKFKIAIFCAGMPSYRATEKIAEQESKEILNIRYRGNGWPGAFTVNYTDGTDKRISYERAWMDHLGKDIHFRCKICPDSIGTIADISVGDSWVMENGKVVFDDRPGMSCILVHTTPAKELVLEMVRNDKIELSPLNVAYLDKIQPNHIRKRLTSAYKLPVISMMTPATFCLKDLNLWGMMRKYNILRGVKEGIGAIKRFNKWRNDK